MEKLEGSSQIQISCAWTQGQRTHMEDKHCFHIERTESGKIKFILLGVFDGHGGINAAESAARLFPHQMRLALEEFSCVRKAMSRAFHKTNKLMLSESKNWRNSFGTVPSVAGTTATVALIMNNHIVVGNCGDSVAVLGIKNILDDSQQWYPVGKRASALHSVRGDEARRIRRMGGKIGYGKSSNEPRVVFQRCVDHCWISRAICSHHRIETPLLNMTRALGDFWSYLPEVDDFVVSCEPHIATYNTLDDSIFAICLHTDGVTLTPASIAHMLANHINDIDKENIIKKSECLAKDILENSNTFLKHQKIINTDNATVITVVFECKDDCISKAVSNDLANEETIIITL